MINNIRDLPVRFIGIDGHGGSGKSTLANLLSNKLGAEIIQTDDFAGFENPYNWWPLLARDVFEPINKGVKSLNYPRSKWWESHNPKPIVGQPVTSIMIIEGVGSLRRELRQYIGFGIFVDTPKDICLQRGFERDKGSDGMADNEIKNKWKNWYKSEETYIQKDNPKSYANIVVDGTKPFDEKLVKQIKL